MNKAVCNVTAYFDIYGADSENDALAMLDTWTDAELGQKLREAIENGGLDVEIDQLEDEV